MAPPDDFQRKINSPLAVQVLHDERIQALIRVAELRQTNLDRLDDTVADPAQSVTRDHSKMVERQGEMVERQKYLDERVDRLVSAVGELVRKQN